METFSSLRDQVLYWLDEAGDTGTTKTNVDNALNQAHQMRLTQTNWPFMKWHQPVRLTLTSGETFYSLHQEFHRPVYFINTSTNAYMIEVPNRDVAALSLEGTTISDNALYFRLASRIPVQAQPAAASTLTIVSDNAGDNTTAKAIIIRGETTDGVTTETLLPNGVTPVTSTNTFTTILQVTKSATWTGKLTLSDASTTLLKLFPSEYGRSYQQIELLTPVSGDTIEYQFYRNPSPLVNDFDLTDIPPPFSQILVWDTLVLFAGYNTELRPQSIAVWRQQQQGLDTAMRQAFLEGQSLEARPRYVRFIEN